jgi:thioredoxin 2
MQTGVASEIVQCPKCGAKNRVTTEQWEKTPICGKCKTPLPSHTEPVEITDHNFSESVLSSPLPVLLDMWAPWCGPCRMIAPVIEQVAREFAGRARVGKLNTDLNPSTASRFQINSIPTLLIFSGGREVDRIIGLASAEEIRKRLGTVVGA